MLNRIVAALVSLVFLVCSSSATAGSLAYMKVKGLRSGDLKGSVTQKGREGMIAIIGASHEILAPRDAQTGLPAGRRQHKAFVVTKEIDRTSPMFYKMLASSEILSSVTIHFWRSP